MPTITGAEVGRHNGPKSCWMVIANDVYDVTKFLDGHPGGAQSLLDFAGKDATVAFETVGHSDDARSMMTKYKIGILPETEHSSHARSCCKPVGLPPCPSDDTLKPSPHRVEFLVYQLGSSSALPKIRSEDKKPWRTFDGTIDRPKSPSKSQYSTPKSSQARIVPRTNTIVVPRESRRPRGHPCEGRNRRPPPESSRLKWALLALAGALVIGFVLRKYAT